MTRKRWHYLALVLVVPIFSLIVVGLTIESPIPILGVVPFVFAFKWAIDRRDSKGDDVQRMGNYVDWARQFVPKFDTARDEIRKKSSTWWQHFGGATRHEIERLNDGLCPVCAFDGLLRSETWDGDPPIKFECIRCHCEVYLFMNSREVRNIHVGTDPRKSLKRGPWA